jgi:hypothetical protein
MYERKRGILVVQEDSKLEDCIDIVVQYHHAIIISREINSFAYVEFRNVLILSNRYSIIEAERFFQLFNFGKIEKKYFGFFEAGYRYFEGLNNRKKYGKHSVVRIDLLSEVDKLWNISTENLNI